MSSLLRVIVFAILVCAMSLAIGSAHARGRGPVAHHSEIRVWHGNRVTAWMRTGQGPAGRFGYASVGVVRHPWHWGAGWRWSRGQGFPHRWWSWNKRHQERFAARRSLRHGLRNWGHGPRSAQWTGEPRREGVWYASPGFGSTAPRGPVRQGEWHSE